MNSHGACIPFGIFIIFPFVMELTVGQEVFLITEQAHLLLAFVTCIADGFPTYFISIFVFLDIFGQCMERPVRRGIGQIHEERFIIFSILGNFCGSTVGKSLSNVIAFGYFLDRHFTFHQTERVEIIDYTVDGSVVGVESPINRIVAEIGELFMIHMMSQPFALVVAQGSFGNVPFTDHARRIA